MISKHFSLKEFIDSNTAKKYNIDNSPNEIELNNIKRFCNEFLEDLRDRLNRPILISSGFRCEKLNNKIGGVKNSQHRFINNSGAVDISVKGWTTEKLFDVIKNINAEYDQLILERPKTSKNGWVHISYSFSKNRKETLKYDGIKYMKY